MDTITLIKKLFSLNSKSTRFFIIAMLCAGTSALMLPIPIVVVWKMFSNFYIDGSTTFPFMLCALAFASIAAYGTLTVTASAFAHKSAFGLSTIITLGLLDHLGHVPLHWFSKRSNGELKKMIGHDVDQIENFIAHNLTDLVSALVLPLVTIPILFFISWQLAIIIVVFIFIAMGVQYRSKKIMDENSLMTDYFDSMALLHGDAVEYVQGMPDIKIFNRSENSMSRMQQAIKKFQEIQSKVRKLNLHSWTAFATSLSMPFVVIAIVGTYLHKNNGLPFEDIVLFIMLGVVTLVPIKRLVRFVVFLWRAGMGYQSVKEILEAPTESTGERLASDLVSANLRVENLSVCYEEKQVLHDVSFTAKEGTVTAIVGPSGSGKSTLVAAIAGLERIHTGLITVGNTPLPDFAPGELANVMSIVYQSPFIFSGTVRDNLCLGIKDCDEDAMKKAAALVQCDTLIDNFPKGYDTLIGSGGSIHLSGGQKQRLALARMALHNAPVVLLDEATAFADPESEAEMQNGLANLLSDKTVLVIAHRLPSIAKAHNILVLDNGRIAESGTHEELMDRDGVYTGMWNAYNTARSWMLSTDGPSVPSATDSEGGSPCSK